MDSNARIMLRQVISKDIERTKKKLSDLQTAYANLQKDRLRPRIERQKERIDG